MNTCVESSPRLVRWQLWVLWVLVFTASSWLGYFAIKTSESSVQENNLAVAIAMTLTGIPMGWFFGYLRRKPQTLWRTITSSDSTGLERFYVLTAVCWLVVMLGLVGKIAAHNPRIPLFPFEVTWIEMLFLLLSMVLAATLGILGLREKGGTKQNS